MVNNVAENNKKRLSSRITLFSFLLSVLVVYLHAENVEWYNLTQNMTLVRYLVIKFEWFISKDVAKAAVPGFFILSGFLFYKRFDMSLYKDKMVSRFYSLFLPYLCWNVLRFVYAVLINNVIAPGATPELDSISLNIQNILNAVFLYKYNLGYWYMFQLILYVILCPAIYILIKNKWSGLVFVLLIFAFNMMPNLPKYVPVLLPDSFFFYVLGAYLGRHFYDVVTKDPPHPILISLILFILSQVCMYFFTKTFHISFYLTFCLLLVCAFFVLTSAIKLKNIPEWMNCSFFIYSLHGTILEIANITLFHILPRTGSFAFGEYILLPILTITLTIITANFLKKKIPFLWRLLNGGR